MFKWDTQILSPDFTEKPKQSRTQHRHTLDLRNKTEQNRLLQWSPLCCRPPPEVALTPITEHTSTPSCCVVPSAEATCMGAGFSWTQTGHLFTASQSTLDVPHTHTFLLPFTHNPICFNTTSDYITIMSL